MWGFLAEYSDWIVLAAIAGLVMWGKIKLGNMEHVVKEGTEFIDALKLALADKKITPDEFAILIKEGKDVLAAVVAGNKEKENDD